MKALVDEIVAQKLTVCLDDQIRLGTGRGTVLNKTCAMPFFAQVKRQFRFPLTDSLLLYEYRLNDTEELLVGLCDLVLQPMGGIRGE